MGLAPTLSRRVHSDIINEGSVEEENLEDLPTTLKYPQFQQTSHPVYHQSEPGPSCRVKSTSITPANSGRGGSIFSEQSALIAPNMEPRPLSVVSSNGGSTPQVRFMVNS